MSDEQPVDARTPLVLNLFCSREGEAWRVHVRPTWLPRHLHECFDRRGEAYPVMLDFADLDRHMRMHGAEYEQRVSTLGGVELTARGPAVALLADWLSSAFASGVRVRGSSPSRSSS